MVRMSKSRSLWLVALSFDPARHFRTTDVKVMTLARQIFFNPRRRCQLYYRMSDTLHWLSQCMTATIEARLPYIRGHSERVAQVAARLGRQMHLPSPLISDLYFAGLLHDIGKVGISETVLLKPGHLSHEEFAQVKEYPVIGERLLANIKQLGHLRVAVRNHCERFDGFGYPDRLAGDDIPLIARVLSVADACDAMMSPRPYRPALPTAQIDAILPDGAGKQWDPIAVEHFMA